TAERRVEVTGSLPEPAGGRRAERSRRLERVAGGTRGGGSGSGALPRPRPRPRPGPTRLDAMRVDLPILDAWATEATPPQTAAAGAIPHVVAWNLTQRCNLACAHCYI